MTNPAEIAVTDQEKKVFRGFYEFFCQYLQEQDQEQSDNTLEFTLFLETFYPHDSNLSSSNSRPDRASSKNFETRYSTSCKFLIIKRDHIQEQFAQLF